MKFTKMHSLGNDFVIIDGFEKHVSMSRDFARRIAHRKKGIGCDQILLLNKSNDGSNFFKFQIFNQDGSRSEQCGNGARCVARYLHDVRSEICNKIVLQTSNDEMVCTVNQADVSVQLAIPRFEPREVPLLAKARKESYSIEFGTDLVEFFALSLGNPHAVITVQDLNKAKVKKIGRYMESHPRFPERTNVGFMEITSAKSIRLRVFERGVGETYACGSGASAAVVAGRCQGRLDESVTVKMKNGELNVAWKGPEHPVILSGPTSYVFSGELTASNMEVNRAA